MKIENKKKKKKGIYKNVLKRIRWIERKGKVGRKEEKNNVIRDIFIINRKWFEGNYKIDDIEKIKIRIRLKK